MSILIVIFFSLYILKYFKSNADFVLHLSFYKMWVSTELCHEKTCFTIYVNNKDTDFVIAEWCRTVIQVTEFSICTQGPLWIPFLAYSSFNNCILTWIRVVLSKMMSKSSYWRHARVVLHPSCKTTFPSPGRVHGNCSWVCQKYWSQTPEDRGSHDVAQLGQEPHFRATGKIQT